MDSVGLVVRVGESHSIKRVLALASNAGACTATTSLSGSTAVPPTLLREAFGCARISSKEPPGTYKLALKKNLTSSSVLP